MSQDHGASRPRLLGSMMSSIALATSAMIGTLGFGSTRPAGPRPASAAMAPSRAQKAHRHHVTERAGTERRLEREAQKRKASIPSAARMTRQQRRAKERAERKKFAVTPAGAARGRIDAERRMKADAARKLAAEQAKAKEAAA